MKKTLTAIALTLALPLSANAGKVKIYDDWVYSSNNDVMTGKSRSMARTEATTGKGRYGDPVELAVMCSSKKTLIFALDWETYLGRDKELLIKVDDEKIESPKVLTGKKVTYVRDSENLAKRLTKANSFIARTDTYSNGPITAIFSMKGSAAAINRVIKDCK